MKTIARCLLALALALPSCADLAPESDPETSDPEVVGEAQEASTFSVVSWPAAFPVTAGAASTAYLVPVSSGANVQFSVQVATNGTVTISGFTYAGTMANVPAHTYTPTSNPTPWYFTRPDGIYRYNFLLTMSWSGSTATLTLKAPAIPGGTIASSSVALCEGVTTGL